MSMFDKDNARDMQARSVQARMQKKQAEMNSDTSSLIQHLGYSLDDCPVHIRVICESVANGHATMTEKYLRLLAGDTYETIQNESRKPKPGEICPTCGVIFDEQRLKVSTIRAILEGTKPAKMSPSID